MAAMARTWTAGVDAGGTWVRALATDDRGRRRRARVRATASDELGLTLERIWRRWHMRRGDVARLVVASRGVWTPAERRLAARRLRGLAREVLVISDAEAAYLGALGPRLHRARARCPGTMDTTRRARPAISRRGLRFLPRADVARARRRSAGSALREGAGRRGADRRLRAARHTPGTGRERHGAARRRRGSHSARLDSRPCRGRSPSRGKHGGELGGKPHGRRLLPRPGVALGATTGTAYRAARAARERPGRRRASSRRPRALSARGT